MDLSIRTLFAIFIFVTSASAEDHRPPEIKGGRDAAGDTCPAQILRSDWLRDQAYRYSDYDKTLNVLMAKHAAFEKQIAAEKQRIHPVNPDRSKFITPETKAEVAAFNKGTGNFATPNLNFGAPTNPWDVPLARHAWRHMHPMDEKGKEVRVPLSLIPNIDRTTALDKAARTLTDRLRSDLDDWKNNRADTKKVEDRLAKAGFSEKAIVTMKRNYQLMLADVTGKQRLFHLVVDNRDGAVYIAPKPRLEELQYQQAFWLNSTYRNNGPMMLPTYFRGATPIFPSSPQRSIEQFLVFGERNYESLSSNAFPKGSSGGRGLETDWGAMVDVATLGAGTLTKGLVRGLKMFVVDKVGNAVADAGLTVVHDAGVNTHPIRLASAIASGDIMGTRDALDGWDKDLTKNAPPQKGGGGPNAVDNLAKGKSADLLKNVQEQWEPNPGFSEMLPPTTAQCSTLYYRQKLTETLAQLRLLATARPKGGTANLVLGKALGTDWLFEYPHENRMNFRRQNSIRLADTIKLLESAVEMYDEREGAFREAKIHADQFGFSPERRERELSRLRRSRLARENPQNLAALLAVARAAVGALPAR